MVTFYRRLPRFDYLAPQSLEEALTLLSQYGERAKVIAGGTDLIPKLKRRLVNNITHIIDLKGIPGLDYIRYDKASGLTLGPLTTIQAVEKSDVVRRDFNILFQAAESMASPQVRNRGTVAGNICNAVPSADTAPALLVLQAKLTLLGRNGMRTVSIEDFFTGPNSTCLAGDELLSEIHVPKVPPGYRSRYFKLSPRTAMDLAVAGVAVVIAPENGLCKDIRIALGAVGPTPFRAREAEAIIRGKRFSDKLIEQVSQAAAGCCRPITDHRASAEYRAEMVKVLTGRAIKELTS